MLDQSKVKKTSVRGKGLSIRPSVQNIGCLLGCDSTCLTMVCEILVGEGM